MHINVYIYIYIYAHVHMHLTESRGKSLETLHLLGRRIKSGQGMRSPGGASGLVLLYIHSTRVVFESGLTGGWVENDLKLSQARILLIMLQKP